VLGYPHSVVLQQRLVDLGLVVLPGEAGGWPCFAGKLPDDPDAMPNDIVAIFDTAPIIHTREMRSGEYHVRLGNQIQVRSANYLTGWLMAKIVVAALLGTYRQQVIIDSVGFFVQSVSLATGIAPIGFDDTGRRHVLAYNVTSTITGE